MELNVDALVALAPRAVLSTLVALVVKGFAGFLYRGVAAIGRVVWDAIIWVLSTLLRLVWWALIGWWWRRWIVPMIW